MSLWIPFLKFDCEDCIRFCTTQDFPVTNEQGSLYLTSYSSQCFHMFYQIWCINFCEAIQGVKSLGIAIRKAQPLPAWFFLIGVLSPNHQVTTLKYQTFMLGLRLLRLFTAKTLTYDHLNGTMNWSL